MQTIGDRIKQKRKELGLTQIELAEKLNVTDRAVSKWEIGEGDPSISLLVAIAETLNISIDYLVTGKENESISIDDMDSEKREMLFIKKDDVKSFEKYGYVNPNIVLRSVDTYGRSTGVYKSKVLEAIFEHHSKKIFTALVNASLKTKENLTRNIYNYGNIKAITVCCDLDKYIKMCSESGCVEGLEFIDLKFFMVGNKTTNERSYFHIRSHGSPGEQDYCTCTLALDTLKYVLNPKTSTDAIIDYVCDIEFYKENANRVYFITDAIIAILFENGDIERINKILEKLKEYNKYATKIYNESTHDSWYTGKGIHNNAIYFSNNSNTYLRAYVYPINDALNYAMKSNDFKWVKEFNKYNKELNNLIPDLKLHIYSDDELKLIELKTNKKAPIEELYSLKFLKGDFFDIHSALNCDEFIYCSDILEYNETKIKQIKELKSSFISKYFISPMELIFTCLKKKNNKKLFEFATDLQYDELQNAVLDNNKNLILEIARKLFVPDESVLRKIDYAEQQLKNVNVSSGEEATISYREKMLKEGCKSFEKEFIASKESENRNKINIEYYVELLKLQFANIPFDKIYSKFDLDTIENVKSKLCDSVIKACETEIESITHKNQLKKEYEKLSSELTSDFLVTYLEKGNKEIVVIKLCILLESTLKYKFGIEGDLVEQLNTYIKNLEDNAPKSRDCDDGWGYMVLDTAYEENEVKPAQKKIARQRELLYKLRVNRNNMVHPTAGAVSTITDDEIKECIEIICNM